MWKTLSRSHDDAVSCCFFDSFSFHSYFFASLSVLNRGRLIAPNALFTNNDEIQFTSLVASLKSKRTSVVRRHWRAFLRYLCEPHFNSQEPECTGLIVMYLRNWLMLYICVNFRRYKANILCSGAVDRRKDFGSHLSCENHRIHWAHRPRKPHVSVDLRSDCWRWSFVDCSLIICLIYKFVSPDIRNSIKAIHTSKMDNEIRYMKVLAADQCPARRCRLCRTYAAPSQSGWWTSSRNI